MAICESTGILAAEPHHSPEDEVVAFLRRPQAYGRDTGQVAVIETHISWVFLTESSAYKLKKPVRFAFVDFSSPDLRRAACENELRLNNRMAPGVYHSVMPICRDGRGRLHLGENGTPVDWVVKMKRLPADRALDCLLRERRCTMADATTLSRFLVRFYSQLPPLTVQSQEFLRRITQHVQANSQELSHPRYGFDRDRVDRVHEAQFRFIQLAGEMLVNRARDGRIVDGHGDLRPEHVYLGAVPQIIDCLEFSPELRAIDVVDELAFLAMECDLLDSDWLGKKLLAEYSAASGDDPSAEVIDFFKCYRACVRAKVLAIRSTQLADNARDKCLAAARNYLAFADRLADRLGRRFLVVIHGLSGSGKSTLAENLSQALGCRRISTDDLRDQVTIGSHPTSEFNTGKYSEENRQRVYEQLFAEAESHLERRLSVVLDGTFLTRQSRQQAVQIAGNQQAVPLLVHCQVPRDVATQRIRDRLAEGGNASEFLPEHLTLQSQLNEPSDPTWPAMSIDATDAVAAASQSVFDQLEPLVFPSRADSHT